MERRLQEGYARMERGDIEGAELVLSDILRDYPLEPNACNFMGLVRKRQGRFEEAQALHRKAITSIPEAGGFHHNLANTLGILGRVPEAIASYREAIRLEPGLADAYLNLGKLLWEMGQSQEAFALAESGLKAAPTDPELWSLKGQILSKCCNGEASLECHRRALSLAPRNAYAWGTYGDSLLTLGEPRAAIQALQRCSELKPNDGGPQQQALLAHQYTGDLPPAELSRLHREWSRRFLAQVPEPVWECDRAPERRLKIGYLSPDFRTHSVMMFLEAILEYHDRSKFCLHGYDVSALPSDAVTESVKMRMDSWRKAEWNTASELAELIRQDGIDILVDLGGHTGGGRLDAVALRPAPNRLFWLGYPGSTGVEAFTARLTDAVVDPPGEEPLSAEAPCRLSTGFHCFTPDPLAPDVAPLPALERGHVTFGSFNKLAKHTPELLKAWAQLLRRIPGSRLFMKAEGLEDSYPRDRILEFFREEGVGPSRLDLLGRISSPEGHLGLYGRVDLALDTFPYNGVTTTCQALWMGVPVVTCEGPWAASRYGASLLRQAGLSEFIARDLDDYLRIATAWASDLDRLSNLRVGMRDQLRATPLLDGPRLTREVEGAYRSLWRTWCQAQA